MFTWDTFSQWLVDRWAQYGPGITGAATILLVGILFARLLAKGSRRLLAKTNLNNPMIGFFGSAAYFLMLALVIVAALNRLGVATTSVVAIFGAAGLAVGLALQNTLSNFASGVMLLILRPFAPGDFINVAGVAGSVEGIQVFSTQLRTPDNKIVFVPNAKVTGDVITNFSARDIRRLDMVISISYDSDLKKAKEILTSLVQGEERILPEPEPVIAVLELGESSVNLAVRPWVRKEDFWLVQFFLLEQIKLRFDAEGIKIPFPQRQIHVINTEQK